MLHIASEVGAGDTNAFDSAILRDIRAVADRPGAGLRTLRSAMLDFTALRDTATLTIVVLAVTGALLILRRIAMRGSWSARRCWARLRLNC